MQIAALLASSMNGNPAAAAGSSSPDSPVSASARENSSVPQALQNLQRLLQSQLANVNPLHLHQAIQRQQVSKQTSITRRALLSRRRGQLICV